MITYSVQVGTCPFCGHMTTVPTSSHEEVVAVLDWIQNRYDRPLVQEAFPHFTVAQREAMISGAHSACFDKACES